MTDATPQSTPYLWMILTNLSSPPPAASTQADITLALSEQCRNTAVEMIRHFKDAGALISFDVNFRGNLWTGDEARECIRADPSLCGYLLLF